MSDITTLKGGPGSGNHGHSNDISDRRDQEGGSDPKGGKKADNVAARQRSEGKVKINGVYRNPGSADTPESKKRIAPPTPAPRKRVPRPVGVTPAQRKIESKPEAPKPEEQKPQVPPAKKTRWGQVKSDVGEVMATVRYGGKQVQVAAGKIKASPGMETAAKTVNKVREVFQGTRTAYGRNPDTGQMESRLLIPGTTVDRAQEFLDKKGFGLLREPIKYFLGRGLTMQAGPVTVNMIQDPIRKTLVFKVVENLKPQDMIKYRSQTRGGYNELTQNRDRYLSASEIRARTIRRIRAGQIASRQVERDRMGATVQQSTQARQSFVGKIGSALSGMFSKIFTSKPQVAPIQTPTQTGVRVAAPSWQDRIRNLSEGVDMPDEESKQKEYKQIYKPQNRDFYYAFVNRPSMKRYLGQ